METQECTRCKVRLPHDHFQIKRSGRPYKTCKFCQQKLTRFREKYKCQHGKQRHQCKECGNQTCEHNRRKYQCRDCGGSQICEHDRRACQCRDCGGSQICEHDRQKSQCIVCRPERACQYCLSAYVEPGYRFQPYCFRCYCVLNPDIDIPRQFKLKEHHLRDSLKDSFPSLKMVFDKAVDGGCSHRRPDVRIECLTHTIIVECDENQHENYSCEDKRAMELFQDLGSRPLVLIRFNPDPYIEDGQEIQGSFRATKTGNLSVNKKEWDWRVKELKRTIMQYLDVIPGKEFTSKYLFYS